MLRDIRKAFQSLVFFIFSEGLQSSCVYTARGREMIVERKKNES